MNYLTLWRATIVLTIGAAFSPVARAQDFVVPHLHGQLVLKSMPPSTLLNGRKITTWVYLPPGYDAAENASQRYPVVYLLHGSPGGWTDCYESGHVEEMADSLIQSGELPPVILVAFEGSGPRGVRDTTNFCNRPGDGYREEDFMVGDLVPYIDATYRTIPEAGARALWGYSAGGYGALNVGFKHPDVWRVLCSHAGFYTPEDDAAVMQKVLGPRGLLWDANNPLKTVDQIPLGTHLSVYMDASPNEDDYQGFQSIAQTLQKRGDTVSAQSLSKAHAWRLIAARCRDSLLFVGANCKAQ